LSQKATAATPGNPVADTRRASVVDTPCSLPPDLPRTLLRFQRARWQAILDPAPPARLHLFRRQPLWTADETPARRRLMWIGVANLPFLQPIPLDDRRLAEAAAWHLERALGRTARRRVEMLTLAAGLTAAEHGIDAWALDVATMELRPSSLVALLGSSRSHPVDLRLPETWRRELPLLLSSDRTAGRAGHARLAACRLIKGRAPGTAHARQAARVRLHRLAAAAGLATG
jgi:hypothetical protein